MIAMYVENRHKTWAEILPYVTYAYNRDNPIQPFRLEYGRDVQRLLDAVLSCTIHDHALTPNAEQFAQTSVEAR